MNPSEREYIVLRKIVQSFIENGMPVGSRTLAKNLPWELSAATIRNIMADLEDKGYLTHPHTSAGRIPTDKAYRVYVNAMMGPVSLPSEDLASISDAVLALARDISRIQDGVEEILYHSSRALAKISNELGIILAPQFHQSVFDRMRFSEVANDRVLIELSLRSGFVKTVILDVRDSLSREHLQEITQAINERLNGLTVDEIRKTFGERLQDLRYRFSDRQEALVRVLLNSAAQLFHFTARPSVSMAGTTNILSKPDFVGSTEMQTMFALLEEKERVAGILAERSSDRVTVTIGEENGETSINGCSIITAPYRMGEGTGTVGLIGPKRMPYEKLIPLVEHTARILDKAFSI